MENNKTSSIKSYENIKKFALECLRIQLPYLFTLEKEIVQLSTYKAVFNVAKLMLKQDIQ